MHLAPFEDVVEILTRVIKETAEGDAGPVVTHQEVTERLWNTLQALPEAERDGLHLRVWADMLESFVKTHLDDLVRIAKPS